VGIITLDLPVIGQSNVTEDAKIRNDLSILANVINGNLDASNLSSAILSQLGNFKVALTTTQVQDVGNANQIRAGRVLTPTDFTNLGLSAPLGLWNLTNLNDSSGNGRNLVNKGSVTFDTGITGTASESALFTGSAAQAFYIVDTGGSDPFRIRTGSWGCWFRTAKRGVIQRLISKMSTAAGNFSFAVSITAANMASNEYSTTGSDFVGTNGTTDVADDRWHFAVATFDGTKGRIYVDGAMEGSNTVSAGIFVGTGPLNIGGRSADSGTATTEPHFGRVDESFVTADVLSPEQVYNLYCASVPHTLGVVPTGTRLAVRRRKRGGTISTGNFPVAGSVSRLYNFTGASLNDEGANATPLTSNPGTGAIVAVAGADGVQNNGYSFSGAHTGMSSTDAGLPSGLAARSYGCWFKTTSTASQGLVAWGTPPSAHVMVYVQPASGLLTAVSGSDAVGGPVANDGQWHHVVVVEDNAAADLVKRKLYYDGRMQVGSTVMNSTTLAGANRFRIGASTDSLLPFIGQIDGGFVYSGSLTPEQVKTLYNLGSQQLAPSPKVDAAHVEALELTRVLAHFDSIEGTDLVDLAVIA
jgi:hypothetical protein